MHPGIIAETSPDKPAYIMAESGKVVTFKELNDTSMQGAQLFRSLGLKVGDHIAILLENHPRFFQLCWAAQRAGLYYTAISYRLQQDEVEYIVNDCKARVFISSKARTNVVEKLVDKMPGVDRCYMLDGVIAGFESWEDSIAEMSAEPIADEIEGASMLYSSGTTGRPKGILHELTNTPFGELEGANIFALLYSVTVDSIYLSPAPLYHSAPLNFNMAFLRMGVTCIIMEHFDAEAALRFIEQYEVTHSQWVPTMFVRMTKLPESVRNAYDVSSLQVAIHAAAPCPIKVKEQMIEWWGPVLHEYYAGTEGNGFVAINSEEWLSHKGSVGRAVNAELHIVDDEGNDVPQGDIGTIYFAGGREFEYHNDPLKTSDSRNREGWSTLGDVGYVDAEGYLYLTDRKSYMIISGGVNIYPQEAENILVLHPGVTDVAVFGVPNEEFGEEVKAVVQPVDMNKATPEFESELIDYCRSEISHIKCPKSIDFMEELPRHPTGKLYKRLLKDKYWQGHSTSIL
jgi:acyl-CoA synthetase (AMP-forming)/AMP-acid ligase II